MQFNFLISKRMSVNENGMTILNGLQQRNPQLDEVITTMGEEFAKLFDINLYQAQNLKQVQQVHQDFIIKLEGRQCLGILKVGKRIYFIEIQVDQLEKYNHYVYQISMYMNQSKEEELAKNYLKKC